MTMEPLAANTGTHYPAWNGGDLPIFLIGMMGVGKTTIGRQLALAMEREFIDLDHAIEERCGVRVSTIFDIEGESGFRRRETLLLDEYTRIPDLVLATGGGAVLAEENRAMLRERGCVVYLRAEADELYRRVARDRSRPLLQTENPRQRLNMLLEQRRELYESVADIILDTGDRPVNQVLGKLVPLLQSYQPRGFS